MRTREIQNSGSRSRKVFSFAIFGSTPVPLALAALVLLSSPGAQALTNGLALTPPMGWSTWYAFLWNYDESVIRGVADAMVTNGMRAAGYEYINLDDCWQGYRDTNGEMVADTNRFPSGMKALADYVHSRGFKFGIYSARGTNTCQKRPGSRGYEELDAVTYASWGVDFLKYDNCDDDGYAKRDIERMRDALAGCSRPMVFSISLGWFNSWMSDDGNLWRTTLDIWASFDAICSNLDGNNVSAAFAGPGHWSDPDMLMVGRSGITEVEARAQFSLWCIVAAPLLAGNDVRNMSSQTLSILTNPEVIAIDQDPAGVQGVRVASAPGSGGNLEVWSKPLGMNGAVKAVALFNRSTNSANMRVDWADVGLPGLGAAVRDVWAREDLGVFTNSYSAVVPAHGAQLITVALRPRFDSFTFSTNALALHGSGGPPNASYLVLASTNVVAPEDQWVGVSTNWFDAAGGFGFTNAVSPGVARTFFRLQVR
jgi:alpha-galactosidase